jgi:hypothetical protein
MQNVIGLIEITSSEETVGEGHARSLALLLALAELLPETARTVSPFEYPARRLRMCSIAPDVIFAKVDVLRRELDAALADLRLEIDGASRAA